MATNPQQPQDSPASEDHHYDEHKGVYGFFRRHQKKLLYTAGLFTLLTFSITGPMQSLVGELFGSRQPMPTIVVNGERVQLTSEDYTYGNLVAANYRFSVPQGVMPEIGQPEGGENELGESFAILRRAAIAEGLGVSMVEVDKAIETARESAKLESVAKLARQRGFGSVAQYRLLVQEAMRIGTYMRLQLLAVDNSDAQVMQQVISDREKITLQVATFDEKARMEELKAASTLTDEELRTWLDEKTDAEKQRMSVYDLPRTQLRFAALLLGDAESEGDKFDPSQWQEGVLKDFTVGDDQLQSYYDQDKDLRFKIEGTDDYRPIDDEAVKAELTRIVQAEQVMNDLLGKVRQQQIDALKPMTEELTRVQGEIAQARQAEQAARQEQLTKEKELVAKKAELVEKPDDEALKAAVAELETALQAAKDTLFAAEAVVPAKQAAVTEAEEALAAARAAFDMAAVMTELTAGKSGFVQKAMTELADAEALKDLDEIGLDLGTWPQSTVGTNLQKAGDLSFGPSRTEKAVTLFQAIATEPKPLKAWEELEPLLEDAYWTEKATAEGKEKRTKLSDTLLSLAKEKMPEFVQERESSRETRVDERMTEWEAGVAAVIAEAEQTLARPGLGTQARTAWQRKLDTKQAELAAKEQQRKRFETLVEGEIKAEIATEAKKYYGEVLAAAAAEAGFTVRTIGPHPRDLQQQPRFKERDDPAEVYLFSNQSELEEGDATAVLYDGGSRLSLVAVCTKVEPLTPEDVSRREFEMRRKSFGRSFAWMQTFMALQTSFSKEALEARYQFERAAGRQEEAAAQ